MRKIVIIVLVVLVAGYLLSQSAAVQRLVLAAALPAFPDYPEPAAALDASDYGELYFATQSAYDLDVLLSDTAPKTATTGLGYLTFPQSLVQGGRVASREPVPAMVIVSGSGGITPGREHEYAAVFNEWGIASFVIDYYRPRGVTSETPYMMKVAAVTEFDVVADAFAALQLLGTHPAIDASRIGIIGFSYGGMAARFALDQRFIDALAPDGKGFALHIDVYGPCFQNLQSKRLGIAPLLTLRGTEDRSNDLVACAQREAELAAAGVPVESHVYPGAGHGWETSQERGLLEEAPYIVGCELRYDEAGRAFLNGEPFARSAADADRLTRVATRLASGAQFQDCVQYGYIMGRDSDTHRQADARIRSFLGRHFGMPWSSTAPAG